MDCARNTRVLNGIPSNLLAQLEAQKQIHVLQFWDELDASQQENLITQLESIDFTLLHEHQALLQNADVGKHDIQPCVLKKRCACKHHEAAGDSIIRRGELGVLTVAGGDGTRLGWGGPKGTYPATPITGKSLFQVIAEQIGFAEEKYGVTVPWYIMTSVSNHEETKSFLLDNNCFGLDRANIFLFVQSQVPSLDATGKLLLVSKYQIAMHPDGHGGIITALKESGALAEMEGRGIQYLSYVQVDNPLARVIDPVFLAMHAEDAQSSNEASSKAVLKKEPQEKVGVFCESNGHTRVTEYSDLSETQSAQLNEDGSLAFGAGSIAIHLFTRVFLEKVASSLPWHTAHKKVSTVNSDGEETVPTEPNAYKFEKFVFDVLPFAAKSLVVEVDRADEFAPIKNKTGADSPKTSHELQLARASRWLREVGIDVPQEATVELSSLTAASPLDLQCVSLPKTIPANEQTVL